MDNQVLLTYAIDWVRKAGEKLKKSFLSPLIVDKKSNPNDLVTNMDKEIEQFFVSNIRSTFPSHRVLGEEGKGDKIDDLAGIVWLIDPIDGTTNFVHQQINFAISIGIYENGIGKLGIIYDVIHDELFYGLRGQGAFLNGQPLANLTPTPIHRSILGLNATWITENKRINPAILSPLVKDVRGTRSYGSAAIEIAYVASGRLDAYISLRLSPWDIAGGKIIIEEVGGIFRTLRGEPIELLKETSVIVTKPGLYEEIFENYLCKGKW